jgi:catecholate siderophore receptor
MFDDFSPSSPSRPTKTKKNLRKKDRNKSKRQRAKAWLATGAMSALMACAPIDAWAATPTVTRTSAVIWEAIYGQSQSPAQATDRYDIPAGDLESALTAFQKVNGWRIVVPLEAIRNLPSPGVSGVLTAEQALKQILTGTKINYRMTGPDAATLELPGVAASIEVMGQAAPLSSPKYTEPLRDIPQTITVIPKTLIEEQGATTLRDVLRNVPGLTMAAGEGGAPAGDSLTLRGFSARNDIFIDGVRDLGAQSRDPFNLEQVEVIKGPGSAYTGRGSAGGTINLVSKSPQINRFFGASVNFGTDETKRFTGDVNLPFGARSGFRLNLLAHESGVAGRDAVNNQRWGIAPSVLLGLGTRTRVTLSYFYLGQDNISDYGIPWVPNTNNALVEFRDKPAPVPRNTFYGFRDRDHEDLRSDLATVKFERDFSDEVTLRSQLRFGYSSRDSIATPPRFANPTSTTINREMRSWIAEDRIWDSQTDLRARFSTGSIEHALVTGLMLTHENNIRQNRTAPNSPTTLLNPNPDDVYTGVFMTSPFIGDVDGKSLGLYAFDTAKVNKYLEFTGGIRFDHFDVDGVTTAPAAISRVDKMTSWRAGVIVKPVEAGSIYASYGTSLSPSLEGLSYGTANTAIEPEKTYTFEVGSKWDVIERRLSLSGAVFRVEKTNARTPGVLPDDPPQVLQGLQRVNGIELGATGSLNNNWTIFGGYSLLDSEIVDSNTPAEVGKQIQNTPRNSFNVWSTYQLPWRVSLGGGVRFIGRRAGNNIGTRFVDDYWTLDALVAFPLTKGIDLRLNLYNLNNAYYFDRLAGGHVVPGAGRSANISTSFRF